MAEGSYDSMTCLITYSQRLSVISSRNAGLEIYRFKYRFVTFIRDTVSHWEVQCVVFAFAYANVLKSNQSVNRSLWTF